MSILWFSYCLKSGNYDKAKYVFAIIPIAAIDILVVLALASQGA